MSGTNEIFCHSDCLPEGRLEDCILLRRLHRGCQERDYGGCHHYAHLCHWDPSVGCLHIYKQLLFAGKIFSYAASSFKENMVMFVAFIPLVCVYALHDYLFVLFGSKSIEVVNVEHLYGFTKLQCSPVSRMITVIACFGSCESKSPGYTNFMVVFISASFFSSLENPFIQDCTTFGHCRCHWKLSIPFRIQAHYPTRHEEYLHYKHRDFGGGGVFGPFDCRKT
eukprot:scaffold5092_cov179-Amphora_coffeaeformis.AAC.19